jgi:UDP-glucose 4-epimerase
MKVLVVGGAGYIGSCTAFLLAEQGHDVRIFDNLAGGYRSLVPGLQLIHGDILDRVQVDGALKGVEAILHFAAKINVGESVHQPRDYFENNVTGTLNLLDAAVDAGIKSFIFSSTCAVYGVPQFIPLTEEHPFRPINPYGATKLCVELALDAYSRAYGLSYVALRYFNAAGADEKGRTGEMHQPETHLIPNVLRAALGVAPAVQIFGDDYPTPDGTCIRDYIHVSDLADAHARALNYLTEGKPSTALNLGTGTGTSVKEIIEMVQKVTGKEVPHHVVPRREGDPPVLLANAEKARQTLGWVPSRNLEAMVATAWEWLQKHPE